MTHYKLWCDAGSLGNPGYCYGSYLIKGTTSTGSTVGFERSRIKLSDHGTNNQAEYWIMIKALDQFGQAMGLVNVRNSKLTAFTDSKLLQQQISGHWKTRLAHIKELKLGLEFRLNVFSEWTVNWVPREQMVKLFGH